MTRIEPTDDKLISLKNDTQALSHFLQNENNKNISRLLEKFGRLNNNNSKEPLLYILKNNKTESIRVLAIKNLAKLSDISLLDVFVQTARNDQSTEVRKEAVSAIGRLRNEKTINILKSFLQDHDPKIILQAIRGLMVFAKKNNIKDSLKPLSQHSNEIIKEVIEKIIKSNVVEKKIIQDHDKVYHFLKNKIVLGDVQKILLNIPDDSIHLTFTSPPYYNARDYSIYTSYQDYLNFLEKVFKEVHRITKHGRFFVLNTSPIIMPRVSRAHSSKRYPIPYDIHPLLVKMGWEFIDDIVWLKPEASVKNRNAGFLQHRKPLGYKPNAITEMLMVYRKKTDKLIDWNMRQYNDEKTTKSKILDDYETSNVWNIDPTFDKVHSAVFPIKLCKKVIQYYSFIDDVIFDPFAGSGTLGRAAAMLDRYFFLTEKEPKYFQSIKDHFTKITPSSKTNPQFLKQNDFVNLIKNHNEN
ncbi:MAG: DNA methyltransferase [Alphaproteobacteria bacterium]